MTRLPTFVLCLLLVVVASAQADGAKKLAGTLSVATESLTDPKPNETPRSHVRFYITGPAAAELYRALPSKAARDECFADGTLTKSGGEIMCSRHPKATYECWFGIELRTQKVVAGFLC